MLKDTSTLYKAYAGNFVVKSYNVMLSPSKSYIPLSLHDSSEGPL